MREPRAVVLMKSTLTTFPYKIDVEIPYKRIFRRTTAIESPRKR